MATNPMPEPVDPVDEDIQRALADPEFRASLEEFEAADARGELEPGIPHEDVRRMVERLPDTDD